MVVLHSKFIIMHRKFHLLAELGWAGFDLGSSTICPTLLWQMQMGFWQEWLGKMAKRTKSKSTQPKFTGADGREDHV